MPYKRTILGRLKHYWFHSIWHIKVSCYRIYRFFRGVRKGATKTFTYETKLRITVEVYEDLNILSFKEISKRGYLLEMELENDLESLFYNTQFRNNHNYVIKNEIKDIEFIWPTDETYNGLKCMDWDKGHPDLLLRNGQFFFGNCLNDFD